MTVTAASFFEHLGDQRYQPTVATTGPWSADAQHGGPPIALLAHAMRVHGADGAARQLARLTVEILGPVPLAPCEVHVEVERPGKRIELLRATMSAGGRPVLYARAWRLEPVPGTIPVVPDDWTAPPLPQHETPMTFLGMPTFPYGEAVEWRFVEGAMDRTGPATVWARPRIPLVAGQETDGLEALLLILDSANGISAELDIRRWTFVPVDLTLNVTRHPHGPWFGMAARTVIADDGIGLVHTRVFDDRGPLGRSQHTLFVRSR